MFIDEGIGNGICVNILLFPLLALKGNDMKRQIDVFSADDCLTALGRKLRSQLLIEDCEYCEKTGMDIFYQPHPCPFCHGSLKMVSLSDDINLNK